MVNYTDEEEELDPNEQRRKTPPQGDTIGSMPKPSPRASTAPPAMSPPEMSPDTGLPQGSPDTIGSLAPRTQPQGPGNGRMQSSALTDSMGKDLSEHPAGQPRYHGIARVADTIAQMTWPGQAAEIGGEFGTLGRRAKTDRLAHNADIENDQAKYVQEEDKSNADVAHTEAQTKELDTGSDLVDVNTPSGPIKMMRKNLASPTSAIINATGQEHVQDLRNKGAAGLEKQKEEYGSDLEEAKVNLTKAQTDLAKFRANPNSPMYRIAQEHLKMAQGAYQMKLKEYAYNYDPTAPGILDAREQGNAPTDMAGNPVGLHSPLKPGSTQINAAQRASQIVAQLPRLTQEVNAMRAEIGPDVGRWNRFWQGDVGAASPQFAHLRDDMEYAASAIALAHAYGRLPQTISDKFDQMYEAGKQDPDNMIAALQVAGEWLPKMMKPGLSTGEQAHPVTNPGRQGEPSPTNAPNSAAGSGGHPTAPANNINMIWDAQRGRYVPRGK